MKAFEAERLCDDRSFCAIGGDRVYKRAIRGRQNGNPGYEVVQQHRRVAELQSATKVARTIRNDINNAFTAIRLSTEKLRELKGYDEISVRNILSQATYIRDALNKLAELEK